MRPELDPVYARENTRLRNIGRRLSAYRDRAVLVETFDALRGSTRTIERRHASLHPPGLGAGQTPAAARRGNLGQALQRVAARLRAAAGGISAWPLEADGFDALAPGLTAAYRKARRAMADVRADAARNSATSGASASKTTGTIFACSRICGPKR